ncbi:hypothetical protein GE09DRAFT_1231837 [Coniochaeta sp. 2T2.1]|nr:hypothetical protein GE09DRAFT_1231837 [Coniochaeta sp. 2T2.1]
MASVLIGDSADAPLLQPPMRGEWCQAGASVLNRMGIDNADPDDVNTDSDTSECWTAPPARLQASESGTITIQCLPAIPSPPASDRSQSPSKRIKLSRRSRDSSRDDDDDPFLVGAADTRPDYDSDQTPRRNTTANIISNAPQLTPRPPQSVASLASGASAASRTTTSTTTSRARSTSPTKKTQRLVALKKPIHHIQIDDNKTDQLPEDIRDLYNRLYSITSYHKGIAP